MIVQSLEEDRKCALIILLCELRNNERKFNVSSWERRYSDSISKLLIYSREILPDKT